MRFTIKMKLGLTFALVILLSGATAWFGITSLATLNEHLSGLVEGPMKRLELSQRISLDLMRLVRNEKNLTLLANKDELGRFDTEIVKPRQALLTLMEQSIATASPQNKPAWTAARAGLVQVGAVQDKIRSLIQQGDADGARHMSVTDIAKYVTEINADMQKIEDVNKQRLEQAKMEADAQYLNARSLMIAMIAGSSLLAIIASLWIAISISRALNRAGTLAQGVASGDLTKTIEHVSRDEVGDLVGHINAMVLKLRGVVSEALRASDNVSSGSEELSSSSDQLSQGATEQASATDEVSSSMEEMAASIKQNADNAAQTEKISSQSASDAKASGDAVARAVEAMQTIAGKITIVQEIARQTDLLALNAAVEAARAGEHGKGFAVVASEVRKLAERSQLAAAEISDMSSQTVKAATAAGEMLTRLVPDIQKTAELVTEISAASREQEIGAEQINKAIQQLDQVTQQNASASEQMSATSEELAAQAEQLQGSIAYFKTDDSSAAGNIEAPSPVKHVSAKRNAKAPVERVRAEAPAAGNGANKLIGQVQAAYGSGKPLRKSGVKLDLGTGGHDHHDAQFERAV